MTQKTKRIAVLLLFSIAMAALESAVVVYLRALYYHDGFTVALKVMDPKILLVEMVREASTIIMLGAIAFLNGKTSCEKFAYFLLCFGVWDIFYYVWLKIFLDWPVSFFEWDILFLIPVTWLAPVLSPIICSITMILLAVVLLRKRRHTFTFFSKMGIVIGSLLIFYTYVKDYLILILKNNLLRHYFHLFQDEKFITMADGYLPHRYAWTIFWLGEIFICALILEFYFRFRPDTSKHYTPTMFIFNNKKER